MTLIAVNVEMFALCPRPRRGQFRVGHLAWPATMIFTGQAGVG